MPHRAAGCSNLRLRRIARMHRAQTRAALRAGVVRAARVRRVGPLAQPRTRAGAVDPLGGPHFGQPFPKGCHLQEEDYLLTSRRRCVLSESLVNLAVKGFTT